VLVTPFENLSGILKISYVKAHTLNLALFFSDSSLSPLLLTRLLLLSPYLLLLFRLGVSKPDWSWLTIINLVVGNGGRVMVN
jgi:hypothetical protein